MGTSLVCPRYSQTNKLLNGRAAVPVLFGLSGGCSRNRNEPKTHRPDHSTELVNQRIRLNHFFSSKCPRTQARSPFCFVHQGVSPHFCDTRVEIIPLHMAGLSLRSPFCCITEVVISHSPGFAFWFGPENAEPPPSTGSGSQARPLHGASAGSWHLEDGGVTTSGPPPPTAKSWDAFMNPGSAFDFRQD